MSKQKKKTKTFIHLTGVPRSGSTWAGQVIGQCKKLRYYHEPFHPERQHIDNPFEGFFTYLEPRTSSPLSEALKIYLEKLMHHKVPRLYDVGDLRNSRKLSKIEHPISRRIALLSSQIPLIKDPPSILLSEWFYHHFKSKEIIMLRHPAAFVASCKKANWHFGMQTFLEQADLMNRYLEPFREEMKVEVKKAEKNFSMENSILFWRIMHAILADYRKKYPDWIFVRHEDLLRQPQVEFERIFQSLELEFTPKIQKFIEKSTSGGSPASGSRLVRDSKKLLNSWKSKLSATEQEKIRQLSEKEWKHFYTSKDW